jgi:hypothetical protein
MYLFGHFLALKSIFLRLKRGKQDEIYIFFKKMHVPLHLGFQTVSTSVILLGYPPPS